RAPNATDRQVDNMSNDGKGGPEDKTPSDELREGLLHIFSAARKIVQTAEPHVARSLDDAERVINKIGRGGEVVANEVGKEVATLATKLAEKLRQVAARPDEHGAPGADAGAPPASADANPGDSSAKKP